MNRSVLLDVARSLAVLLVIAHHLGYRVPPAEGDLIGFTVRSIGWVGVDLFFVISGYFVASILYSDRETLKGFFYRRVFRIVPLYQVAAFFFISFTLLGLSQENLENAWFLFSFLTAFSAIFNPPHEVPFLITWSITVEVFFYAISSIYFMAGKRNFFILFSALYLVSFLTRFYLSDIGSIDYNFFYFFPFFRFDGFIAGFVLFWAVAKGTFNIRIASVLIIFSISMVVLLVRKSGIASEGFSVYGYTILAMLFGLFCFGMVSMEAALKNRENVLKRILHVFIQMGQRSYFFYLFHLFFIEFIVVLNKKLFSKFENEGILSFWEAYFLILLLLYCCSWFSWKIFEKPLIDYSRKF